MGGINWAGFDLICEKMGVEDVDDLTDRLLVIKMHKEPKSNAMPPRMEPPAMLSDTW